MKDTCKHCEVGLPFSGGNPNYHKYGNGYVQCYRALVTARLELAHMDNITIQDLDAIVLAERTSLENATIDEIEKRCEELQNAYEVLQRNAKLLKQKQVTALELREEKLGRMTKAEIKEVKQVKKVDDALDMMEQMLKSKKGSSISSVEEKK